MKEVYINGFKYYVDVQSRVLYTDKTKQSWTSFKFLTPNEYSQLQNEIKYPRVVTF